MNLVLLPLKARSHIERGGSELENQVFDLIYFFVAASPL